MNVESNLEGSEAKWFIYTKDRHEGPFSISQLSEKAVQGQLSGMTYVWREGMPDWVFLREVPALSRGVLPPEEEDLALLEERVGSLLGPSLDSEGGESPRGSVAPSLFSQFGFRLPELKNEIKKEETPSVSAEIQNPFPVSESASSSSSSFQEERFSMRGWLFLGFLGLGISVFGTGLFLVLIDRAAWVSSSAQKIRSIYEPALIWSLQEWPGLERLFPLFPSEVGGVLSEKERAKLRPILLTPFSQGLQLEVVVLPDHLETPSLWVGTNLPLSQTKVLELEIEGISKSLVGAWKVHVREKAWIEKRFASFTKLQTGEGTVFPRGRYRFTFRIEDHAPWTQEIFLGGFEDAAYEFDLKAFHEDLQKRAGEELGELQQFLRTSTQHYLDVSIDYEALRKALPADREKHRKAWEERYESALRWQEQVQGLLLPQGKTLYRDLYEGLKPLIEKSGELLNFQNQAAQAFLREPVLEEAPFPLQELSNQYQSLLSEYQIQIQNREKEFIESGLRG